MSLTPRGTVPLILSLVLVSGSASAQDAYVPDGLKPWVPWVLEEQEFLACPALPGAPYGQPASHVCAWPGALALDVTADGAAFTQSWEVLADGWVPLPGDERYWPLDLSVDGRAAGAAMHQDRPAVYLRAGRYRLAGRLAWDRRPASLAVPPATGLVALRLDGRTVASPRREPGVLWLGERAAAGEEPPVLTARVYRRLDDRRPQLLETRLVLDVAGPAREESLDAAVLPGFAAKALRSDLPARLDGEGRLRLQVRPGTWSVTIESRARAPLEGVQVPAAPPGGAAAEVWSYASWPALRLSTLEGGEPVDPAQAGVPPRWRGEPASRALPGTALRIDARPRDLAAEQANALRLDRRLWLDFDGQGLTGVDEVTGTMDGVWRLDLRTPFAMQSARSAPAAGIDGPAYLQITAGEAEGTTGVELRRHAPALTVVARASEDAGGALPVTGYTQRFEQVSTLLHLPPAYRLLWARGVDQAPGAWVNGWTLLDLFLLLLIAVATWRLLGPVVGVVALVALAATFNEPGAPVYSWLNLVIALALIRAAPEGRLKRAASWYRNLSLAALIVLLVPFVIGQARQLIYPQLEQTALVEAFMPPAAPGRVATPEVLEQRRSKMPSADLAIEAPAAQAAEELAITAREPAGGLAAAYLSRYQPPGIVPTGPGLPDWRWHTYRLAWNGPVEPEEAMGLVIAAPWLVRLLRLLAIAASLGLLGLLVGRGMPISPDWRRWIGGSPVLAVLALVVCGTASAPAIAADGPFPDAGLLAELKQRLSRPPPCAPGCAQLEQVTVRARGGELESRLRLHAQADVGVPLPGRLDAWEPQRVRLGGAGEPTVTRDREGQLRLRLAPGVHDVLLTGPLPPGRATVVWFPLPPRWIDVSVPGFRADGISGNRLLSGLLELTPIERADAPSVPSSAEVRIEPFVEVERVFRLDREWTLETTVFRNAPAEGAFTVEVDLLPGEAPTTAGLDLRNAKVLAAFGPDDSRVSWTSVLPVKPEITVTAPAQRPWQERWVFAVAPLWRAEFSGIPPLVRSSQADYWMPTFVPAAGDTLRARLTQPTPVQGQTLAIDRVELASRPGQRSADATLTLSYRSTRGGQQAIRLPAGAKLQSARVDGETLPLSAAEDGRVDLPVAPGEHAVALDWSVDTPVAMVQRTPAVDLGSAASNIRMSLALPANRWVLFASGPRLGPAILYWAELAIFLVVALVLGRSGRTPLRTHQWLLLGLGFSTFAWPALVIFGAWLLAMQWRSQTARQFSDRQFRLLQLGLALFAFMALSTVVSAIPQALLGTPDMSIMRFSGGAEPLGWFSDQAEGVLPQAAVFSVSIWYYKFAMLAWALWLAFALVGWVRWAWGAYTRDGLWRGRVKAAG